VNRSDLKRSFRKRALEEGFDLVGFSEPARMEVEEDALLSWLGNSYHASMEWMERYGEKRIDPARLVPGCRSVVSLLMNYWSGENRADRSSLSDVASFARGRDYHKVLGSGLKRICAWLDGEAGGSSRWFVDTGPVLERAWAMRCGIGWIGKNANLITGRFGSWVFLGEILTTVEIEPDEGPHPDRCGTCTACIDACPTGAIVEPGVVDSNLCISYWTIEHRGAIPVELRPGMGSWIFGCDDCQSSCPWNRSFARTVPPEKFARREDLSGVDPAEILGMDETSFRERFSGTSLMRAGWKGMRRNACVVLGNGGAVEHVPLLTETLEDPDPVIRAHAGWALEKIGVKT